jgi:hypothetical protein
VSTVRFLSWNNTLTLARKQLVTVIFDGGGYCDGSNDGGGDDASSAGSDLL